MDNIRTSSLFHFTGRLNTLMKILEEGLKANFCKEDFSTDDENLIVGVPMISFCDIPLTRITNFTKRYNEYAIGLSKEWGMRNNINPILYISSQKLLNSYHRLMETQERAEDRASSEYDKIESRESRGKYVTYDNLIGHMIDDADLFSIRGSMFGYSKKHLGFYKDKIQCNYDENEWRYIEEEDETNYWFWNEEEYNEWRGETKNKPSSIFQPQTFTVEDINFIIVRFDKQIPALIDLIGSDKLKTFGGGAKLTDNQKKILLTKIISIERIKKDF